MYHIHTLEVLTELYMNICNKITIKELLAIQLTLYVMDSIESSWPFVLYSYVYLSIITCGTNHESQITVITFPSGNYSSVYRQKYDVIIDVSILDAVKGFP